jgi:hypothetical protein
MNDLPAVSAFLRALAREPEDRAAAIRAGMKFEDDDDRHKALAAWLRKDRKNRRRGSAARAIERE